MGSFTTNHKSIELQLMRKLTMLWSLDNMTLDKALNQHFEEVVTLLKGNKESGYFDFSLSELLAFFNNDVAKLDSVNWKKMSVEKTPPLPTRKNAWTMTTWLFYLRYTLLCLHEIL